MLQWQRQAQGHTHTHKQDMAISDVINVVGECELQQQVASI